MDSVTREMLHLGVFYVNLVAARSGALQTALPPFETVLLHSAEVAQCSLLALEAAAVGRYAPSHGISSRFLSPCSSMSAQGSSGCEANGSFQKPQGWTVSVGDVLLMPIVLGRVALLIFGCADTCSLELMFADMSLVVFF